MAPRVRVRKSTQGPTKPGEVVDYPRGAGGPSDPVIVVDSGSSDPVRGIGELLLGAKVDVRFSRAKGPHVELTPTDPTDPPGGEEAINALRYGGTSEYLLAADGVYISHSDLAAESATYNGLLLALGYE